MACRCYLRHFTLRYCTIYRPSEFCLDSPKFIQFFLYDIPQEKAAGNCLAPKPFSHFWGPWCSQARHPIGCTFGSACCSHKTLSPGTLNVVHWTWKITASERFGVVTLKVTFPLAISFVSLISTTLRVSAVARTFNLFLIPLFTEKSIDPVWQMSIVPIGVLPFIRSMEAICKLPPHEFAVSTGSAIFVVSQLILVVFES